MFFEHLGRVHSIHNKWELTFAVKTNFADIEHKLLNISRRIERFKLEEPTVEFVEDERKENQLVLESISKLEDDRKCWRLVNGVMFEKTKAEVVPEIETMIKNLLVVAK